MKNKGFTLVELIVVMALMVIAAGAVAYTSGLISSTRAKTTARDLKAALEDTQMLAMSRGGGKLKLYRDDEGDIWVEQVITNDVAGSGNSSTKKKIGSSAITVQCHVKDGSSTLLTKSAPVEFAFNPATGAFSGSSFIDEITVSGGGKTLKLTLWKMTGRVDIE